jgi:hypothetical protein
MQEGERSLIKLKNGRYILGLWRKGSGNYEFADHTVHPLTSQQEAREGCYFYQNAGKRGL